MLLFLAAGLSALHPPPASGERDRLAQALTALDENQTASALLQLEVLAKEGNAEAAFQLGRMLHDGVAAKPDPAAANYWMEKAAHAGLRPAARSLGEWALTREAGGKDIELAKMWLTRAALAGDPRARRELGRLLLGLDSLGERDPVAAYAWLCGEGGDHAWPGKACAKLRERMSPTQRREAKAYSNWIAANIQHHALRDRVSPPAGKSSLTRSPGALSERSSVAS